MLCANAICYVLMLFANAICYVLMLFAIAIGGKAAGGVGWPQCQWQLGELGDPTPL